MNCPYCDETVHLTSKFCPKCGLPLKEEATVMGGAYLTDEPGPGRWVVIGGAVAIVVVVFSIGWLNSRKSAEASSTSSSRQIVVPAPSMPAQFGPGYSFPAPSVTYPGMVRPSAPSAIYNPQTRWAYTPPATPAPLPRPVQPLLVPEAPPPTHGVMNANPIVNPPRPAFVIAALPSGPPLPVAPKSNELDWNSLATQPTEAVAPVREPIRIGSREYASSQDAADDGWLYDPVQERYVRHPEAGPVGRRRRTSTGRVLPRDYDTGHVGPSTPQIAPPGGNLIVPDNP